MANKVFPLSRSLLALCSSSVQRTTRHLLQSHSTAASANRALSSLPLPTLLGSSSSNSKTKPSNHVCLLLNCGNRCQETVLASALKPGALQVRSYKNMVEPQLICDGCYFVWRHGRKYVECSDFPRHKQMKKWLTRNVWQEDYSKGDVAKAMDWNRRFKREFARTADRTSLSHNWLSGKLGTEI